MQVRSAARTALDAWLKFTRLPFDTAAKVLPNGSEGPRNAVLFAIDRADASVRAAIGGIWNDAELIADAQRRRMAADKREQALQLRLVAEDKEAAADVRRRDRVAAADERRAEAERSAEAQSRVVERDRAQRERTAKQQAEAQKRAVDETKARQVDAAQSKGKRERLQVLETTEEALDATTDALTAEDEAKRLQRGEQGKGRPQALVLITP